MYSFEVGTDVGKAGWKSAVTVEDCIVGGELHAAVQRQPSWSLEERSRALKAPDSDYSCVSSM
jgi:hypothetical protein